MSQAGVATAPSDWQAAWQGLMARPLLAWLRPKPWVRVLQADGTAQWARSPDEFVSGRAHPADARRSRFVAVLLPVDAVLHRSLQLPATLSGVDRAAALALEVSTHSPFAPEDSLWAHAVQGATDGTQAMQTHTVVLASRRVVQQHLAGQAAALAGLDPEVWAPLPDGRAVLLPGFGEARRARAVRWQHAVNAALLALASALMVGVAVTPSAKLYLRVQQAHAAYAQLDAQARPAMRAREAMVRTHDQLVALDGLIGRPVPAVQVLKIVTDALPDDTSLLSLNWQAAGQKVTMSGQTVNAAALMKQLGATPGLRNVTAPTPAIKPLGAPREQFSIAFDLEPPAPPPAAAAPAPAASAAQGPASAALLPNPSAPQRPASGARP
ncbi:MAG: hypothetical protein Fur007_04590 [Rhodoferax sp.]